MEQSFWKPGSIVKLNEPYKPSHPDRALMDAIVPNGFPQYKFYEMWKGFTHGIIVQMIKPDAVSLHLYDPDRHVIYVEDFSHGIPTYVDFHVSELTPLKDSAEVGYTPVS